MEDSECGAAGARVVAGEYAPRRAGIAAGVMSALLFAAAVVLYIRNVGSSEATRRSQGPLLPLVRKTARLRRELDWPNASFIDSLPIAKQDTMTTTVAPRVPCEYGPAEDGSYSCPMGSASVTEAECRHMPFFFGGVLHNPFVIEDDNDPWGCFRFAGKFYYNSGYEGNGRRHRTPFCKRCQAIPTVDFHGPSYWSSGNYMIHRVSSRFRMRHVPGGCRSQGLHPVLDQDVCGVAARELNLPQRRPVFTCLQERPEGCYYLSNMRDGKGMLFLNINPLSKDNGAETSSFAERVIRVPICRVGEDDDSEEHAAVHATDDSGDLVVKEEGASSAPTKAPTTTGSDLKCRAEAAGTRKVTQGTCHDIAHEPILNSLACEAAAKQLALADVEVEVTHSADRPMGCYYFRNSEDLTATLWLNTSPESKDRTAEPRRHLLCAAKDAAIMTTETTTTPTTTTSATSTTTTATTTTITVSTTTTTTTATTSTTTTVTTTTVTTVTTITTTAVTTTRVTTTTPPAESTTTWGGAG